MTAPADAAVEVAVLISGMRALGPQVMSNNGTPDGPRFRVTLPLTDKAAAPSTILLAEKRAHGDAFVATLIDPAYGDGQITISVEEMATYQLVALGSTIATLPHTFRAIAGVS